jgi:hypothetical protein
MSKTWVRIISVSETVGGVFGIGDVIWALIVTPFNALALFLAHIPISI